MSTLATLRHLRGTLVAANATYYVDFQDYAPALIDLQVNDYIEVLVSNDGWGNPLQ